MIEDIGNTGFRGRALYKPHYQLECTVSLIVRRYE